MPDRHLQRDEAAIAIAEHDGAVARFTDHFRHAVGDIGEPAADRLRAAEARQLRHDHAKGLRQARARSASKLARSDSSECNRNSGGPCRVCAALTVPLAKDRSMPSLFIRDNLCGTD